MKVTIVYYSETENTKKMAEIIAKGMMKVPNIEVKCFSTENVDKKWINESKGVIVGSPTHMADIAQGMRAWLSGPATEFDLSGKIGGAFATANYIYGGGTLGIQTMLNSLMILGMLVYSGGAKCGKPYIHLGPVAIGEKLEESYEIFSLYGERMGKMISEIYTK